MPQTISTAELAALIRKPGIVLLDQRPTAGFNGWRLQGEARGGHIPGAIPLPAHWAAEMEASAFSAWLDEASINPDTPVVVYGNTGDDFEPLLQQLAAAGRSSVSVYAGGIQAWAANRTMPIARLARYEKLVHPGWLNELLAGGRPENYSGSRFLLFHVNYRGLGGYSAGHIPGAIYLDTLLLDSEHDWNLRPAAELERALAGLGITKDTTVILYGRDGSPPGMDTDPGSRAGQMAATRAALALLYAGMRDVRLLDGGYDAWVGAGYSVERTSNEPQPVPATGLTIPEKPGYITGTEEIRSFAARTDAALVSVRSWAEYTGQTSGYAFMEKAGRIPGAIWGNGGADAYDMQPYRNRENGLQNYEAIAANWAGAGIRPDKRIAFYCGTGWRAAEAFFAAHLMRWEKISVYDGGWYTWSSDDENPFETGAPTAP